MKVSIVIPIYNVGQYLRDCLESCLAQTYDNLEIICVDDGSTDDGGSIADEYAARDSRFKVIHKPNGGLPSARKAGIEAATGDYLFHLDGDDNIPEDAIVNLVSVANKEDSDIVIGDYILYNGENLTYFDSRIKTKINGVEYLKFIFTEGVFNIWGKLIRRSLYVDNPVKIPKEISIGEDLVAMIQLAYFSNTVSVSKKACYTYYIRPTSMSRTDNKTIGQLTDRLIFAIIFIIAFLNPRADEKIQVLLMGFVRRFIYEYMRSPYSVSLRKTELKELCEYYKANSGESRSFAGFICHTASINLSLAKMLAQLRNFMRK